MSRDDAPSSDLVGSLFDDPAADPSVIATAPAPRPSRARRHDRRRRWRRRRRRIVTLVSVVVLLGVLAGGYPILRRVAGDVGSGTTPDYTGAGTGTVTVQVHAGDATPDIATTLKDHDVVASKQAFVAAAARSGRAQDFQPGFFRLRRHMAASQAVTLLLQPANRVIAKVTVKEGTTVLEVLDQLHTQLRLPATDLKAAAADVKNLGLPAVFGTPKSAEGFLYPQTYQFDPDVTASEALQAMAAQFTSETDGLDFGAHAKALGYSPYQVLIIASLIQRESKFAEDRAKVARVVLNRMKSDTPIQFDSSSVYGAELEGKDLRTITYKETSPYNLRIHPGLPPTPITNPEVGVMQAALNPPAGNWLYFVNRDAAGHLFFTNSYKAFLAASDTCRRNNWGCT